jgi:type II secretory ATPase GspE/PulE/Tfp pilus assembly ATPase PilB-like protein
MQINVLAGIEYGGYVALYKLLLMLAFFLAWLPLVNWVYVDCQAVKTDRRLWTMVIAGAGSAAIWLWLLIPFFWIGFLIYLILVGSVAMSYVIHRNGRVADFEKVLTADHLRSMLINPTKKVSRSSRGLSFVTANKNDVPLPDPKSPDAEAFQILCEIIDDAIWRRVSQIVLTPQKDNYAVVYEIDGVASSQGERTKEEIDLLVRYLKQLADLDVEEKRKPQSGSFAAQKDGDWKKKVTWEVQTAGSTAGEQIRIIKAEDYTSRKLSELGLNENQFESIRSLRDCKGGLVLLSGPAKSGVTSTMYAMLGNHDPFLNNVVTLERKIAAELPSITQNEYTLSDTGTTTFSRKLQSLLRRGPDIVGVSDCDEEIAAKLCCSAAKDGKMVYATLAANSVIETVDKFLKLAGDKNMVADALEAVINQRLVRALCPECRQAYKPNPALFKKFNIPADQVEMFYRPAEIEYDKHGKPIVCEKCQGTGFYGRMGLFETIRITDEIRQAIRSSNSMQDISSAFRKAGMLYMQEQSIKKVTLGSTSINEVIRNFASKNG